MLPETILPPQMTIKVPQTSTSIREERNSSDSPKPLNKMYIYIIIELIIYFDIEILMLLIFFIQH